MDSPSELPSLDTLSSEILTLCLSKQTGIATLKTVPVSPISLLGELQADSPTAVKMRKVRSLYMEFYSLRRERGKFEVAVEDKGVRKEFAGLSIDTLRERAAIAEAEADLRFQRRYGNLAFIEQQEKRAAEQFTTKSDSTAADNAMAVVSKLASELSKLKAQIHSVRKDIKQLHKENRQTTSQLISLIQEHKHRRAEILSDDAQRLIKSYREAVSVTEQKIETLKPVLLGLIMGSGLNWSTDESLREIVLECSSSRRGNSDSSDDDDGSFDYDPGE